MDLRRHQPADMRNVGHQVRADLVCNLPENAEVNDTRVGARARDDELGLYFMGHLADLLIVQLVGIRVQAIEVRLIHLPAEVDGSPMGQMAPLSDRHGHDPVPRLQRGEVGGHVGL